MIRKQNYRLIKYGRLGRRRRDSWTQSQANFLILTAMILVTTGCSGDPGATASCTPEVAAEARQYLATSGSGDANQAQALLEAARDGDESAVRELLQNGATPDGATADVVVESRDGYVVVIQGGTPLLLAAHGGHNGILDALICAGADLDAQAANGETSLHRAVSNEHLSSVELLLYFGASPNPSMPDFSGLVGMPLHIAAGIGNKAIVELLLDAGANINAAAALAVTPLQIALNDQHMEVAEMLLERGADPNPQIEYVRSALHIAVRNDWPKTVDRLLAAGANPNVLDGEGFPPLTHAVADGQRSIVISLLDHGADPNIANQYRETALDWAVAKQRPKFARLLLDAGANPLSIDLKGRTSLDIAKSDEMRELLRSYAGNFEVEAEMEPANASTAVQPELPDPEESNRELEAEARSMIQTPEWQEVRAINEKMAAKVEEGLTSDDPEMAELIQQYMEAVMRAKEAAEASE